MKIDKLKVAVIALSVACIVLICTGQFTTNQQHQPQLSQRGRLLKTVQIDSPVFDQREYQVEENFLKSDYEKAIKIVTELHEQYPKNPKYLTWLGWALLKNQQREQSFEYLVMAHEMDISDARSLYQLAYYFEKGSKKEAEHYLKRAIRQLEDQLSKDPLQEESNLLLGQAYALSQKINLNSDKISKIRDQYLKVLTINPNNQYALYLLGTIFDQEITFKIKYLKKAVEVSPQFAKAWCELGYYQLYIKETTSAKNNLKKCFEMTQFFNQRQVITNLLVSFLNKDDYYLYAKKSSYTNLIIEEILQDLLVNNPQSIVKFLEKQSFLLDYEANSLFKLYHKQYPKDSAALKMFILRSEQNGYSQSKQRLQWLRTLMYMVPEDVEVMNLLAEAIYFQEATYSWTSKDEVVVLLSMVEERQTLNCKQLDTVGLIYSQNYDYKKAEEYKLKLLETCHDVKLNKLAYTELINLYSCKLNDSEKALSIASKCVEAFPKYSECTDYLIELLNKKNDKETTLNHLLLIQNNTNQDTQFKIAGMYLDLKEYEKSNELLVNIEQNYFEIYSENLSAKFIPTKKIGYNFYQLEEYEEAIKKGLQVISEQPDDAWAINLIADSYFQLYDDQNALDYYLKLYEVSPKDFKNFEDVKTLYKSLGKLEEAKIFEKNILKDKEDQANP